MNLESLDKLCDLNSFGELALQQENLNIISYKRFTIPKSDRTHRTIYAPNATLKKWQQTLSRLLYDKYSQVYKNGNTLDLAHGFLKKRNIYTNAKIHQRKVCIIKIDLQDFFNSFHFERVRCFFIKDNKFNLDPEVASVIAQIACYKTVLPQGSPCSPIITNFIAHILDRRLFKIAKTHSLKYSRYADDITFSTNTQNTIKKITRPFEQSELFVEIKSEIERSGFTVNMSKVKLVQKPFKQIVTGLTVNEKVNVCKKYYKYARAIYHSLLTKSIADFSKLSNKHYKTSKDPVKKLCGILGYINYIKNKDLSFEDRNNKLSALLKPLLVLKYFFMQENPFIITEGVTDVTHLKCAMYKLNMDNKYTFNKKYLFFDRTSKPQESDLLKIIINNEDTAKKKKSDNSKELGGSELITLIRASIGRCYKKISTNPKSPVIILVDNDQGGEKIEEAYTNVLNKKEKGEDYFSDILKEKIKNHIFIVVLPKRDNNNAVKTIECLYNEEVRNTVVEGKTFCFANECNKKCSDTQNHLSKKAFAEYIEENKDSINFDNFIRVFEEIDSKIAKFTEEWA